MIKTKQDPPKIKTCHLQIKNKTATMSNVAVTHVWWRTSPRRAVAASGTIVAQSQKLGGLSLMVNLCHEVAKQYFLAGECEADVCGRGGGGGIESAGCVAGCAAGCVAGCVGMCSGMCGGMRRRDVSRDGPG